MFLPAPPTEPVNLQAATTNDANIYFTWSVSFSPFDVSVIYVVMVSNADGMILLSTNTSLNAILYFHQKIACSVFTVSVHAFNKAGLSNQSSLSYTNPNFTGNDCHYYYNGTELFNFADIEESSAVVRCSSVTVTCIFKLGSSNIGCHVNLVYTDKLITEHDILRVNESIIIEDNINIPDFKEVADVLIFDLRNDSTASNVTACRNLTFDCSLSITIPGWTTSLIMIINTCMIM